MGVNKLISQETLKGDKYYWFFTLLMLAAAAVFIFVAWTYRGQTHMQDEQPAPDQAASGHPQAQPS